MNATPDDHPLYQRAAEQTPAPSSATGIHLLLGTLLQLKIGQSGAARADDAAKAAHGLPHVRPSRVSGSQADVLVAPWPGGAVRVGFDLPSRFEVPTLPRFGNGTATYPGSQLGAGVS